LQIVNKVVETANKYLFIVRYTEKRNSTFNFEVLRLHSKTIVALLLHLPTVVRIAIKK